VADGVWPYLFVDGMPIVCRVHEWRAKQQQVQRKAVTAGLSYPIPAGSTLSDTRHRALISKVASHYRDGIRHNPLLVTEPPMTIKTSADSGRVATSLAVYLRSPLPQGEAYAREHAVFLMHRSQAINLAYSQREREAEDVLMYAPVLVYWDNKDDKRSNGRLRSLIDLRQYGYAFIVE
jgi:hypothetical protein